jgi:hypothetical protein
MIKKILIILVLAISATACSKDKRATIPPDVIPPEQMMLVLVDVHLVEASLVQAKLANKDIDYLSNYYYWSIMKKHHITYKKLNESIKFYSSNLKELYLIYEDVASELSTTQSRIVSKK